MKSFVKSVLKRAGFEVRRTQRTHARRSRVEDDPDFQADFQLVRDNTMLPAGSLASLYDQVSFCERQDIRGAFVECGTWKGGAVGLMALANRRYGREPRHLHLFDSFRGIPEPNASVDGPDAVEFARLHNAEATGRLRPISNAYGGVGTLEDNRKLLERVIGYGPEYLHYHEGWFQSTVPAAAPDIGPIAILRLDGDWYESTKVCLEHLYQHTVAHAFIIIDDYETYAGCRQAVDEFRAQHGIREYLNAADRDCRYWIKP